MKTDIEGAARGVLDHIVAENKSTAWQMLRTSDGSLCGVVVVSLDVNLANLIIDQAEAAVPQLPVDGDRIYILPNAAPAFAGQTGEVVDCNPHEQRAKLRLDNGNEVIVGPGMCARERRNA